MKLLKKLLLDIYQGRPSDFGGIGIVVYKDITNLPISPLYSLDTSTASPISNYNEILNLLLDVSSQNHKYHDGFHLLSSDLALTHISAYFSTPIVHDKSVELSFGCRYRTAYYGSFLQSVHACGIVSKSYPPTIFIKGEKILVDEHQSNK